MALLKSSTPPYFHESNSQKRDRKMKKQIKKELGECGYDKETIKKILSWYDEKNLYSL